MAITLFNTLVSNRSLEDKTINIDDGITSHFDVERPYLSGRVAYVASKQYTDYHIPEQNWNYITEGVILGAIPYENQCDEIIEYAKTLSSDEQIKRTLGLVVSVTAYFELNGSIALSKTVTPLSTTATLLAIPPSEIATPRDWVKKNIQHYSLPMQDFTAKIPVSAVIHAVDAMRTCILNNQSVYIHCKAGRGRSYLIAAVYLAIYDPSCFDPDAEKSLDNAMKKISSQRKHVNLDSSKRQKALDVILAIKKIMKKTDENIVEIEKKEEAEEKEEKESKQNDTNKLDVFLSLAETKMDIAQLLSFKELAAYCASFLCKSSRLSIIKDFCKEIDKAKN